MNVLLMNLLHTAALAAAVYVPAYVLQSTLVVTLAVYAGVMVLLNILYKHVAGGTGLPSGGAELAVIVISGFIPLAIVATKFGVTGALALIVTAVATSFLTMYI
jgi:hypothetical protein